jgi:hypothetical protein
LTQQADPIERAKSRAESRFPGAEIRTKNHRGRPVVLATSGDLIRLVWTDLRAKQASKSRRR